MHRICGLVLCACLAGCGVTTSMIKSDALSFNDAVEDATNKLLVLNVLRARDKAPLHFADIPVIRESMQQNATLGYIDLLGGILGTTTRNTRAATIGAQFTPSFEVTSLHSKEFNIGMTTPIDPKIVKYWLDRGLDRRIVLLLFFSAAEIIETVSEKGPINTMRIANSPRDAIDIIKARRQVFGGPDALRCDTQSDFERYLKLINTLSTFFAHTYRERRMLARGLNLDVEKNAKNLQSFAALDQNKIQLVYDKGLKAYNVFAVSPESKVAFCLFDAGPTGDPKAGDFEMMMMAGGPARGTKQSCFQQVVEIPPEDSTRAQLPETPITFVAPAALAAPSRYCAIYNRFTNIVPVDKSVEYPRRELRLHIRSVGEIFQFLGDLVHYQEQIKRFMDTNPQSGMKINTPVTFGYCADKPTPGCDDIFVRLDGDRCNARFTVTYRDRDYHVANHSPTAETEAACGPRLTERKDHTLEILGVMHQLIGLHRSAADLRQTPTVQVLP
jgi:hypothetical protein